MAIVLTNGKYYITHIKTGAVIKVADSRKRTQGFYAPKGTGVSGAYCRTEIPGCTGEEIYI